MQGRLIIRHRPAGTRIFSTAAVNSISLDRTVCRCKGRYTRTIFHRTINLSHENIIARYLNLHVYK